MSLKGNARRQLTRLLKRLLKSEEIRLHANSQAHEYDVIRRAGLNQTSPYGEDRSCDSDNATDVSPIFITGRFRSGSTLLWNLFRNLPGHTAFYEPFNERRWFDQSQRGGHTDKSHRGVSEYWSEYQGLAELTHVYNEDWIRYRLYMSQTSFDYRMKRFIGTLAAGTDARAGLQFNRVDFRLPWLRANFPEARIVHVYRNPRDQWCSTLHDEADYPASASSHAGFPDHFYLEIWFRDLVRQFPFLADYEAHHRYFLFYLIWKLSYCFGVHYSDISLGMEALTQDPFNTMTKILAATGTEVGLAEELDVSFVEAAEPRWPSYAGEKWFTDIEQECDEVVREFFQGVVG
jgi:hypothetical protein